MKNIFFKYLFIAFLINLITLNLSGREILFLSDFRNQNSIEKWQITDEGDLAAPSEWKIINNSLVQLSNIQKNSSHYYGTYSVTGNTDWENYIYEAEFKSEDNDILGFLFCYINKNNYYRLRLMGNDKIYKEGAVLEKIVDGKWTVLKAEKKVYISSKWHSVKIIRSNNRIIIFYDDMNNPLFNIEDSSLKKGKIGVYSWANAGSYFSNIEVYKINIIINYNKNIKFIPLNETVTMNLIINNLSGENEEIQIIGDNNIIIENNNKKIIIEKNNLINLNLKIKGINLKKGKIIFKTKSGIIISNFELFIVRKEDAGFIPLFCDFHMHTTYSDGINTPYEMVYNSKKAGLDVIAITDHMTAKGSDSGRTFLKMYNPRMLVIRAEENHKLYNNTHILAINLPDKVNSINEECKKEILNDPAKISKWAVQNNILLFQAHPTWTGHEGSDEEKISNLNYLLEKKYITGFEYRATNNTKSILYKFYNKKINNNLVYTILANSDAHKIEDLGNVRTIVLAKSYTEEGILNALKNGKTVVIDKTGKVISGPPELVKIVKIFIDDFLPVHDGYAKEEAEILRLYMGGHGEKKEELEKMHEKWMELYESYFPEVR